MRLDVRLLIPIQQSNQTRYWKWLQEFWDRNNNLMVKRHKSLSAGRMERLNGVRIIIFTEKNSQGNKSVDKAEKKSVT
jgi:hypothetical protein